MPANHHYNHPAPVLPPADSLPFPANLIVGCSECGLRDGCTRPVPGEHTDRHCDVMLVGQNPGFNEDREGRPFIGQAGKYLDSLLFQCGISRESVCITNIVHCLTPNNRQLRADEIRACSHWLDMELDIVQPQIVVAMGAPAIAYFLGKNAGTVEHLHGKPVGKDGRIILPAYHPAAALRDTAKLRQCQDDFQVLRGLVRGRDWREYHVEDEYPEPVYRVVDTPELLDKMVAEVAETGEFAVDTEICRGKFWSVQISAKPGTAWFIPIPSDFKGKYDLTDLPGTAIVHNYLFDINYLDIREDDFVDSMTQAYLLGQPQGLKELTSRLCGIQMVNYREMVRPGQQDISLDYLLKASGMEWPDPPTIEETKWDNKKGCLTTKTKKPWHISRKIRRILDDFGKDDTTDLWDRWRNIPAEERAVVEDVLGAMPESSLADIPFEDALSYSARDADATLRVYHKLKKMITDADLDFIQYLDLSVLPQVYEMMRNGMTVDIPYLKELSSYYSQNMEIAAGLASAKVGHPFNPNSSKQVAEVVYGELGFKPTRKTATGLISTDDQELKKVEHPVITDVLEYRRNLKNKSTFADALVENAIPHQQGKDTVYRVHTTLKTTRTETGRLSSADPINLQTMPVRSEDGKKIRKGFRASPGYKLLAGDFCLAPGTRVLTLDMQWLPIELLVVGQKLVGMEELRPGAKRQRRMYPTEVVRVGSRVAQSYLIVMADGKSIIASAEHPWLAVNRRLNRKLVGLAEDEKATGTYEWTLTRNLEVGDDLCKLTDPWEVDNSWSAGYLAGAFDGEGCLNNHRGSILSFNQRPNPMLLRVLQEAGNKGFKFHNPLMDNRLQKTGGFPRSHKDVCFTWICNSNDIMRFLGMFRPPRLLSDIERTVTGRVPVSSRVPVVGIMPIGEQEVISLETTTHTFVAEGYFTHNSQQEMRLQAHEAKCENLLTAYQNEVDVHTLTASRIFGVPMDIAEQAKYRYPAKTLNFSVIYIVSARGLYENIHEQALDIIVDGKPLDVSEWTEDSCQRLIDDWYRLNWEVKDWQMEKIAEARRFGYVRDIFGRIRYIPEVSCPIRSVQEAGGRMCVNFPIQGGCASITKLAMLDSYQSRNRLYSPDDVRFIMAIHDEIMLEVKEDMVMEIAVWLKRIMDNVVVLDIPMVSEIKAGDNWAEMSKIKLEV